MSGDGAGVREVSGSGAEGLTGVRTRRTGIRPAQRTTTAAATGGIGERTGGRTGAAGPTT